MKASLLSPIEATFSLFACLFNDTNISEAFAEPSDFVRWVKDTTTDAVSPGTQETNRNTQLSVNVCKRNI